MLSTDEAWKAIVSESKRLSNIADYILDVGKIESGTFTYDMRPVNVKKLIESVTSSASKLASEDGLITISAQHENQDVMIFGDKERLIQALSNIINNAVKFAKNGTITIATKPSHDKGMVEISITDDGPGIPQEILPVLFSKFVTKTQENERGTGLGLFITKTIIEAHNGTIRAENNSTHGGKGASFTISLPVKAQKEQTALAEKQTI
jgi:signal transduction histidine kinase